MNTSQAFHICKCFAPFSLSRSAAHFVIQNLFMKERMNWCNELVPFSEPRNRSMERTIFFHLWFCVLWRMIPLSRLADNFQVWWKVISRIISRYQMSCLRLLVEHFRSSLSFLKAKWPAKPLFIILLDISMLKPFQNYPAASTVLLHFPKLAPISICYRRPGLGKISVLSFHKIQPVSDCVPYLILPLPPSAC